MSSNEPGQASHEREDAGTGASPWTDRRTMRTSASKEAAWRAFADARIVQGWFADEAELQRGRQDSSSESDAPSMGDVIVHRFPAFGFSVGNEVIESEPGERLVLRISFPGRPPVTQEIIIRADAGETVIEMTNSGFGAEEWEGQWEGIDSGWKLAFALLRHYLEHHFGRHRRVWFAMRPSTMDRAAVRAHFHDAGRLSQWLTDGGPAIGAVGEAVRLELRDAPPLEGVVLAASGTELMLSWPAIEGVLELKTFSAGPHGRMIALRASSWAGSVPAGFDVDAWLAGSLDRLAAVND